MSFVLQQLSDPGVQLCAWVLIGAIATELLVVVWAAVGPQHWFWRGLGLWAAVMVMAPLGAWQVIWALIFTAAFVVGIVLLGRGIDQHWLRRLLVENGPTLTRYRYSLRDLLLLVFLICLWLPGLLSAARNTYDANWPGLVAVAAIWAGLAVVAAKLAFGPRRMRAAILLAMALPLAAFAFINAPGPANFWLYVFGGGTYAEEIVVLAIFELELSLVLMGVILLVCAIRTATQPPTVRIVSAATLTVMISVAAVGLGFVYADLLKRPPQVARFELPGNQFARIREIAQRVNAINSANEPIAEIRQTAASAARADELTALYAELLLILPADNAVLYDPETDAKFKSRQVVAYSQTMRGLCRSLRAESEWARQNGLPDVAADYALACLGLSESLGRGGVALDALISRALEGPGQVQLAKVSAEVSPDKLKEAIGMLTRAERRDDLETVRARDLDFGERTRGFLTRLESTFWKLKRRKRPWEESFEEVTRRHTVGKALLQAELARQLFKREKGQDPASLDQLVPEFLPAVPIDVYSGQPLKCKAGPQGPLIYSVGRDGVDDGGRFTDERTYWSTKTGYDYDLEMLMRP
jgi:hypothetical protein